MKKINVLFFIIILYSQSLFALEKHTRKPTSTESVEMGIRTWKSLIKCSDDIIGKDQFLKCSKHYVLEKDNERKFIKVVSSVAGKFPGLNNIRECSANDLERFPFHTEKHFDVLICFNFSPGVLEKTVISYLEYRGDKLYITDFSY